MRRLLPFLLSLLVALSAAAAETRKYAVLSLIGDEMMMAGAQAKTGARLDQNAKRYLELSDPFADKAALLAVHEVLKEKYGTEPVLLFGRDRRLYQAQARLLESGSSMSQLLADIRPLLGNSGATDLVLIEDVWGGMPAVERVRALRDLLTREVRAMLPRLLSESDR